MLLAAEASSAGDALRARRWHSLADQIERAAGAVPANLAEGSGRASERDFARFVAIAGGSLRELETHVLLARQSRRLPAPAAALLLTRARRVAQLLHGLHRALTPSRPTARRSPADAVPRTP